MSEQGKDEIISQLREKIEINNQIIANLREFFGTYQSEFLKIYRQKLPYQHEKMESILATQEKIFAKFEKLIKKERQS
jgi:hypothetical protein